MTKDEAYREYDRLAAWRSLWQRLGNRKPKTWRGKLQTRAERVDRRAAIKNQQILDLMRRWDIETTGSTTLPITVY